MSPQNAFSPADETLEPKMQADESKPINLNIEFGNIFGERPNRPATHASRGSLIKKAQSGDNLVAAKSRMYRQ